MLAPLLGPYTCSLRDLWLKQGLSPEFHGCCSALHAVAMMQKCAHFPAPCNPSVQMRLRILPILTAWITPVVLCSVSVDRITYPCPCIVFQLHEVLDLTNTGTAFVDVADEYGRTALFFASVNYLSPSPLLCFFAAQLSPRL